eukprot:CAMPEP_0180369806 /NCGR_PEP_ID=MMETSP0989-20121125/18598_1 /TAXON_ID=697907 /ORGANISM="non described non described, Strain CCMP2293" /LENGTH=248 /DNA_ID=CAMNT_0022365019 /DNA_START=114 /DNA_END=858 /DNA_ORIENTATION=+
MPTSTFRRVNFAGVNKSTLRSEVNCALEVTSPPQRGSARPVGLQLAQRQDRPPGSAVDERSGGEREREGGVHRLATRRALCRAGLEESLHAPRVQRVPAVGPDEQRLRRREQKLHADGAVGLERSLHAFVRRLGFEGVACVARIAVEVRYPEALAHAADPAVFTVENPRFRRGREQPTLGAVVISETDAAPLATRLDVLLERADQAPHSLNQIARRGSAFHRPLHFHLAPSPPRLRRLVVIVAEVADE